MAAAGSKSGGKWRVGGLWKICSLICFVSPPSRGLKPLRTVAELQETQERSFRVEVGISRQAQEGGESRGKEGETGSGPWEFQSTLRG